MASVTFDTVVGGDGSTVTDDDDPSTGLGNGGALLRLVPAFAQVVTVAETVVTAAASSLGGATTNSTSTTSLLIGTGSKSIALVESGKAYTVGQYVMVASTASPSNYMVGQVTAFSGTSLTVNVTSTGGSGTIAAWSISVTGVTTTDASQISTGTLNDARLPIALSTKTITGLKLTKTAPAISTGVVTLDLATANVFAVSLNANITSFTVTNIPASGTYAEFAIELTADGTARTVTWVFNGVAVRWTAPTLTSTNGKKDTFVFYTHSGGTEWMGFKAGQNL
jgi:hypothetical protein